MQVVQLLDAAKQVLGSDAKIAERLGIPFQHVSQWRHEKRTCTPEDRALLASIAGLDPQAALIGGLLEKYEGTTKGDLLKRALGKAARGAVAMLIFGVSVAVGGAALGLSGSGSGRFFWRLQKATMYRG